MKLRKGRMNYGDRKKDFTNFQRTKKKTRRTEKKVRKKLLKFLFRLLQHITELDEKYQLTFSNKQAKKYSAIVKIYAQQHEKLYGNAKEIKDRIVSLSKPYIRPIIRGKETKVVEFGAKVNMLQVDGINFIEHLSYNAFNEGTRLQSGIHLHRKLFGKCTPLSADQITGRPFAEKSPT